MNEALQATELIFVPLGREYPSRDSGLLPLGRSLLLQLAVTELCSPTSNCRSAKPHLTDKYATPEGLDILVEKIIAGHTRRIIKNPNIPNTETNTLKPRITLLVPPGIHKEYIEHSPIISDIVRVLHSYKTDIAILAARSKLSPLLNSTSKQADIPTCSELLQQRGIPHKEIDYDGPTEIDVIRMLAEFVTSKNRNLSSRSSSTAAADPNTSLSIASKNVLPMTVLSCLQRHGLYSLTVEGYPSRARDPFLSIAGWYKHENLREISSTANFHSDSNSSVSTATVANNKRPQIGIFGGSFSPITNGHLKIAHQVAVHGNFDEVWIVPCGPRLDKSTLTVDPIHRHAMSVLGVEETYPVTAPVRVVPLEMREPVALSSYDLMTRLAVTFPFADFSLIIGADLVPTLSSWRNAQQLLRTVHFLVVPRAGYHLQVPDHVNNAVTTTRTTETTAPSTTTISTSTTSSTTSSVDRKRGNEKGSTDKDSSKRNRTEEIGENFDADSTPTDIVTSSSVGGSLPFSSSGSTSKEDEDPTVILTQPRHARYLTHLQDGSPLISIEVSSKYVRERITQALSSVRATTIVGSSSSSSSSNSVPPSSSTSSTVLSSSSTTVSPVSSLLINDTKERQAVANAIKDLVPNAVINYICHNRIYWS